MFKFYLLTFLCVSFLLRASASESKENPTVQFRDSLVDQLNIYNTWLQWQYSWSALSQKFVDPTTYFKPIDTEVLEGIVAASASWSSELEGAAQIKRELLVIINLIPRIKKQGSVLSTQWELGNFENDKQGEWDKNLNSYRQLVGQYEASFRAVKKLVDEQTITAGEEENPWKKTGDAMFRLLETGREVVKYTSVNKEIASSRLAALDQALEDFDGYKEMNLNGIKRMNPRRSGNPDHLYRQVNERLGMLARVLRSAKPLTSDDDCIKFNSYFNQVVDYYHKFVDMAAGRSFKPIATPYRPVHILPTFKEFYIGDYTFPTTSPTELGHTVAIQEASNRRSSDTIFLYQKDTVYIMEKSGAFDGYVFNNMVFLLDVSSSMSGKDKLPMLQKAILHLCEQMRWQDELGIVAYAGKAQKILLPTSAKEQKKIEKAVQKLKASGATNLYNGLEMAYRMAERNYKENGNNRVVLATDGEVTISQGILDLTNRFASKGIKLSIFSFGINISEEEKESLRRLAKECKGNYEHITEQNADAELMKEAQRVQGER
ncbi:VWA domain-containing protein [Flammeovirgaceae bacterium SG7u.111]|nr:VWA domain-containing protein [Flammeovirgaceae bacterium SG7u.132]WPO34428.1 VWA domain-containing protein [Flammeovirgaceae bacterium SG7u.111]